MARRTRRLSILTDRPSCGSLVLVHQPRITDDVGSGERGEAAGGRYCSGTPAKRMPYYKQ